MLKHVKLQEHMLYKRQAEVLLTFGFGSFWLEGGYLKRRWRCTREEIEEFVGES